MFKNLRGIVRLNTKQPTTEWSLNCIPWPFLRNSLPYRPSQLTSYFHRHSQLSWSMSHHKKGRRFKIKSNGASRLFGRMCTFRLFSTHSHVRPPPFIPYYSLSPVCSFSSLRSSTPYLSVCMSTQTSRTSHLLVEGSSALLVNFRDKNTNVDSVHRSSYNRVCLILDLNCKYTFRKISGVT